MTPLTGKAAKFLSLHTPGDPVLQPNAFDAGSARVLASMGFKAIATTSSGFAATLGRLDGAAGRDDTLAHCRALAAAVDIPVAADTENAFADDPAGVAATVTAATATGLAGCSVEDWSGTETYDIGLATERIAAAAEAAHTGTTQLVLTARADVLLRGSDLDDAMRRVVAYQDAGADVLFVPGLTSIEQVRRIVGETDRPVNVLATANCPPVAELAEAGVARISIGGALAYVAYSAVIDAATELRDAGTSGYWAQVAKARDVVRSALGAT